MGFELALFNGALLQKQATHQILQCNDLTRPFGLVLTEAQAIALVETRSLALKENGRVEFGGGVIDQIILAFRDSPYLFPHSYEQTLHQLLEIFYYYKNETLNRISDDDLIQSMKTAFDGVCQGSLDLLAGRELDQLARRLRTRQAESVEDDCDQEEEDEDGGT